MDALGSPNRGLILMFLLEYKMYTSVCFDQEPVFMWSKLEKIGKIINFITKNGIFFCIYVVKKL